MKRDSKQKPLGESKSAREIAMETAKRLYVECLCGGEKPVCVCCKSQITLIEQALISYGNARAEEAKADWQRRACENIEAMRQAYKAGAEDERKRLVKCAGEGRTEKTNADLWFSVLDSLDLVRKGAVEEAFKAGAEAMRERAAKVAEDLRPVQAPQLDDFMKGYSLGCQHVASAVRSLPIDEEGVK